MSSLSPANADLMIEVLKNAMSERGSMRPLKDNPKRLEGLISLSQELRDYGRRKRDFTASVRQHPPSQHALSAGA